MQYCAFVVYAVAVCLSFYHKPVLYWNGWDNASSMFFEVVASLGLSCDILESNLGTGGGIKNKAISV